MRSRRPIRRTASPAGSSSEGHGDLQASTHDHEHEAGGEPGGVVHAATRPRAGHGTAGQQRTLVSAHTAAEVSAAGRAFSGGRAASRGCLVCMQACMFQLASKTGWPWR